MCLLGRKGSTIVSRHHVYISFLIVPLEVPGARFTDGVLHSKGRLQRLRHFTVSLV